MNHALGARGLVRGGVAVATVLPLQSEVVLLGPFPGPLAIVAAAKVARSFAGLVFSLAWFQGRGATALPEA
ncbi:hypothetical protein [Microvirga sp. VF16]|uniref:hypothetical protein n=1 Tax=Microvirga sp. VF16 TaxID=2807101 RepID=UPI00193DDB60|nr:hypothetical protein [Microvirga sp. VF16]QRM34645.1 hypothetical protein JO965_40870 [Microvirga sp. VF16]